MKETVHSSGMFTHALWGTALSARSWVQNLEAPRRVRRQLGSQRRTRAPLPPARSWRKLRERPKASSIWSIRSPLPVVLGLDRGWGDGVVVRAPQKTTEQNSCAAGPSAPRSRTIRKGMSHPCGMTGAKEGPEKESQRSGRWGRGPATKVPFSAVCLLVCEMGTGAVGRTIETLPRAQGRAQHISSSYCLLAVVFMLLFCSFVVCLCL